MNQFLIPVRRIITAVGRGLLARGLKQTILLQLF